MLTIFGANGKSGRELITRLLSDGFSDGLTAAELAPETKNAESHRAQALRELLTKIAAL